MENEAVSTVDGECNECNHVNHSNGAQIWLEKVSNQLLNFKPQMEPCGKLIIKLIDVFAKINRDWTWF